MATCKLKTQFWFVPITRLDEEERIVEGYAFVNETVPGEGGVRLKRSAMEAATADYMQWGAIRSMHQPLAAGTALSVDWDEKGAKLRAKIVDDQEWRKVVARVYKGFSIGVKPELIRGNDVERLTWVENSLVDRPKDADSVFTQFRAEGFDPSQEFEVEVAEAGDAEITEVERSADGIVNAPEDQIGTDPIKAGDCTITREADLYVLNGPDGALIGKFATEAEARARAAEIQDAMKDGPGGKDDATDQLGTTATLPTDRSEQPPLTEGEEVTLTRNEESGLWQLFRKSDGSLLHEAESAEAVGVWIKAEIARNVTSTTPDLPIRENLEGKTPRAERADADGDNDGDKPAICERCSMPCQRCMGTRSDEAPPMVRCCDCGMDDDDWYCPVGAPQGEFPIPTFAENITSKEGAKKAGLAWSTLRSILYSIAWSAGGGREAQAREAIQQFADYVAPILGTAGEQRSELFAPFTRTEPKITPRAEESESLLQRLAKADTENACLILRAESAETELARVQMAQEELTQRLATAKEQITRLENTPAPPAPLRFAQAITREFFANAKVEHDTRSAEITARMLEIEKMPPTSDQGEQTQRAHEFQVLKLELARRMQ